MTAPPALGKMVDRLRQTAAPYRESRARLRAWFLTAGEEHVDWRSLEFTVVPDAPAAEVAGRIVNAGEAKFPGARLAAATLYLYTPETGHLPVSAEMVRVPAPKPDKKPKKATPEKPDAGSTADA